MAPSNMFSYLRPGHAKRTASNLAAPEPLPSISPAAHPLPSPSQSTEYFTSPRFVDNASYASSSPISPYPPQLPPIARVASKLDKPQSDSRPPAIAGRPATSIDADSARMRPPPQSTHTQAPSSPHVSLSARPMTANTPVDTRPTEHGHYLETPSQSPPHLAPSTISPSYSTFSRSQTSLMAGIGEKLSGSSKAVSTPTPAPAKPKSRLNLRNPMSLLMRRRSGQTLDPLADESLVTHRSPSVVPPMPDNYDPSIRGHIVHDFNAPRLNRNFSYNNAYGSEQQQQEIGRVSPQKIDREHTPVFHEHFDDETSYEESQAAIRAEQLVNTDFLARNSVQFPPPEPSIAPPPPPPPPLLLKDLPPVPQQSKSSPPPLPPFNAAETVSTILSPVQEAADPLDVSAEVTPRKRKSTKTPPPARSRATSMNDPSFQSAGLPSHFTSRASRFSFQISGGSDAAQEAILEERHKKKEAEKASKQVRMSTNTIEDDYDEYGMDDYDMDDGFEEEIPMLGEEDDFGGMGLSDQSMDAGINNFDFSSLSLQTNMNYPMNHLTTMGQIQTPVDTNGNPIGFAMSDEQLQHNHLLAPLYHTQGLDAPVAETQIPEQSEFQSALSEHNPSLPATSSHGGLDTSAKQGPADIDLGDDMYFDDGLIGDQDEDPAEFDESVFDDPNGPLYDRKIKPPLTEQGSNTLASHQPGLLSSEMGYEADDDTMTRHLDVSEPSLAHKTSDAHPHTLPDFNNMNAYHSALADAATRAQAAGRFTRKASVDVGQPNSEPDDVSFLSDSRPSLVPDDSRFSLDTQNFPPEDDVFGMSSSFVDDYEYSDYDSALEDDPMIAAANAEALAFDDEGFYGQEFGFYASAVGDSPNAWGGFFGPSGIGRTVSGRNAVREPNLTPITERSEYSTRNSFISLNQFRDGQQPIQSPGLAQLARMSPYEWPEEEGMSIETLMKLRKGAFGGSAASLPASTANSPRNSSPMGMQFAPRISSAAGNRMVEHTDSERESDESANIEDGFEGNEDDDDGLMDAVNAGHEDEDDSGDDSGKDRRESPTLTASDYNSMSSPDGDRNKNIPPLPSTAQLHALHSMQSPSHIAQPMSPDGRPLKSPANMPLPMSPFGIPLASPFSPSQRPTAPPSIDTSLSSPSATMSNSTGPRRPSMALVSPISNSSPITPGGSGWRAGHSRKGSAADSVTYVRDHDEAGEGRWILERRRTAESGELELIGREIVEGGRI
ncbi:hypothetical protein HBI56_214190 [Parastagonospora nodorum]|uniref:AGC-kinase C-terminal domain-containing protein n=1 Tax=Phaeosphaeria nodorum (strain SN15 / ATCC MYA-4574 / FGSC 10173) TaxID=321614 RepID=A0A7U2F613_PHANO|nr:hypothetical protein HBH56_230130 [Parastagonospora nodorum]QRC99384.1 hypothetical protein JI435_143090 [Parastagonospora nodorum SN15]KAH3924410.1 hypothetical protein HBH54_195060 [Parastagonospora nodorum]KAH3940209.1 hypothetical protein HBH53_222650 [Parastagonospora nodorum]KAH3993700.1 hypothetical protein HBI10_198540 [Parastagonospora nodorum]